MSEQTIDSRILAGTATPKDLIRWADLTNPLRTSLAYSAPGKALGIAPQDITVLPDGAMYTVMIGNYFREKVHGLADGTTRLVQVLQQAYEHQQAPIQYATKTLIDSVWTIGYRRVSPTEVEILSYGRQNPIGYEQQKKLDLGCLIEDGSRRVYELRLADYKAFDLWATPENQREVLTVVNPAHVFSYPELAE